MRIIARACIIFLLLFVPLHASNKEFNIVKGFWKLKITGPIDYSGTVNCDLKVSGDLKRMAFGGTRRGQYLLEVEYCGKEKEECE